MKFHLKPLEGCLRLLQVTADPAEAASARKGVLEEVARRAQLPGFRPGKAPQDLVARQFSRRIEEDLLKRLIEEGCGRAIEELKLSVVQIREITDVSFKDERLSFKATLEIRPEVSLKRYKGIRVSRAKSEVRPEEIQRFLRSLQEQHAELIPKEGAVAEGDFILCDLKRSFNGKVIEDKKNFLLSVTKDGEMATQVAEALIGAAPSEKRTVTVALPAKEGEASPPKELICEFVIREVKTKQYPPLEDAFAKQVGQFSTLQELETAVRDGLLKDKEKKSQRELEQKILEQLEKECQFPLPKTLVEREVEREEARFRMRSQLLGLTSEQAEEALKKEKSVCENRAIQGLRQALILDRIAVLEKLEVSAQEIEARIRELSESSRISSDPTLPQRVGEELRLEKAVQFLVAHAQIQEGPSS